MLSDLIFPKLNLIVSERLSNFTELSKVIFISPFTFTEVFPNGFLEIIFPSLLILNAITPPFVLRVISEFEVIDEFSPKFISPFIPEILITSAFVTL